MSIGIATQPGQFAAAAAGGFAQASSVVALWDFESGARTTDSAGSNTLTANGTITYATGKIGDAAGGFSTANYFLAAGHVGPTGTSAATFFGWFKTVSTASGTQAMLSVGIGVPAGTQIVPSVENGVFWLRCGSGRVASYGTGYNDGDWHAFVVSKPAAADLSDISVFIDSAPVSGSVSSDGSINLPDTRETAVGLTYNSGSPASPFPGELDQIGIADTAWSAADAIDHYNSGSGRTTAYLLGS